MDYYIGIDIGTSSTKAVAFSITGQVMAQQAMGYPILHPQPDYSEQQPTVILAAVIYCLEQLAKQLPQHQPVLISFSAAMHSLILIDQQNNPLTNCIIWADNRASEIADKLKDTELGKALYQSTGVPIHAMSPLCKLRWFTQHQAAQLLQTSKCIGIKEFIWYQLFKKYLVDTAIASATGLLQTDNLQWNREALAYAGIATTQLSALVPTTHIEYLPAQNSANISQRLCAFTNTAFVIGSSDGALANLGTGAMAAGAMAVTVGTSSAVRVVTNKPITDMHMRSFCYHLSGGNYIIGGASNNGAVVLQWLKENILQNTGSYSSFLGMAETIVPGSNGLLFLPYILGERAPLWNSSARGVFWGLHISHGTAHMVRAAMEAVIFNIYSIGKIIIAQQAITTIYANGGFAECSFWVQLLADTFNLPVFVPVVEESSALGAVMIGKQALSITSQFNLTQGKYYQPNLTHHHIYVQQAEKMERLYALVRSEF